jgi:hypothetical protein
MGNGNYQTLGWTDCDCLPPVETSDRRAVIGGAHAGDVTAAQAGDEARTSSKWRPGLVLDPFAGSGTTLLVAHGHGHDSIGIDLDSRNLELARERVGPFFFEEVTV